MKHFKYLFLLPILFSCSSNNEVVTKKPEPGLFSKDASKGISIGDFLNKDGQSEKFYVNSFQDVKARSDVYLSVDKLRSEQIKQSLPKGKKICGISWISKNDNIGKNKSMTLEDMKDLLDNSLMLVTALAPHIGYDKAAKIAKSALKNNTTLKHETLKTGLISEKDYNKIVDPKKMIYPA